MWEDDGSMRNKMRGGVKGETKEERKKEKGVTLAQLSVSHNKFIASLNI